MTDKSTELREQLFDAQEMSPALRASYEEELERMNNPNLTTRKAVPGVLLLIVLLVCTAGIVRNLFVYNPAPLVLVAWIVLATAFAWVSFLIVRDLWRKKHSPKAAFSIGHILMTSAGTITVVALLQGLNAPTDPASTFNAFYVFVFYFACFTLALENRIAAAELAAREQMLRIECRLADIAGRLN